MKLVLISDTHTYHSHVPLPEGDVLIHAGDATWRGTLPELTPFLNWFGKQPHKHKILIAGNHDHLFQKEPSLARNLIPNNVTYLEDSGVTINGVNFWGSPWQPWFHNWAFNLERGPEIRKKWKMIPDDTHVLITHGPPMGILDEVASFHNNSMVLEHVGCEELRDRIKQMAHLKLSVFGHIHEAHGIMSVNGTTFVNASICDHSYNVDNLRPPMVVDIPHNTSILGVRKFGP